MPKDAVQSDVAYIIFTRLFADCLSVFLAASTVATHVVWLDVNHSSYQRILIAISICSQDDVNPKGLLFDNTALSIAILLMSQRVDYPKGQGPFHSFPMPPTSASQRLG